MTEVRLVLAALALSGCPKPLQDAPNQPCLREEVGRPSADEIGSAAALFRDDQQNGTLAPAQKDSRTAPIKARVSIKYGSTTDARTYVDRGSNPVLFKHGTCTAGRHMELEGVATVSLEVADDQLTVALPAKLVQSQTATTLQSSSAVVTVPAELKSIAADSGLVSGRRFEVVLNASQTAGSPPDVRLGLREGKSASAWLKWEPQPH